MMLRHLFALVALACAPALHAQGTAVPIDDSAFGLAKGSVFDTATPKPYSFESSGKLIPPPPGMPTMVPHAIDPHLPITVERNACLGCHERPSERAGRVAKGSPRTIPSSHYVMKDRKLVLSGAQYNCTSCHAPQAGVDALVKNAASPSR